MDDPRPPHPPRPPSAAATRPDGAAPGVPEGFEVLWRSSGTPAVVPDPPPRVVDEGPGADPAAPPAPDLPPVAAVLRRTLGRILGDAALADELMAPVLADGEPGLGPAVEAALAQVLEQRGPLGEVRVLRVEGVPFADHRGRIARDLLRWDPPTRTILALRHLAELSCSQVAAAVGWEERDVRLRTAVWRPDDLDPLRDGERGRPLAHLDPPRPFRT